MADYSGNNNVPLGPGQVPPPLEEYVGGAELITDPPSPAGTQSYLITVTAKGDECGRSFYIKGTCTFVDNKPDAKVTGTMLRCTNKVLLGPPCNQRKNYQVGFEGTITRGRGERAGSRQLRIDIKYFPDEKWIRENCKKARVDRGSDSLILTEVKPFERTPTGKIINDDIDEAEKLVIDNLMKGMRKPR
jgi:hypothetical protein